MEVHMDSGAEDDGRSRNLDFDHASVKSLEETQQSWLLEPTTKKKAKQIDLGCMVCSRKLFMIIVYVLLGASVIVGLSIVIWKFAPRKHHHPPPLDNYTIALQKALKFFDAQKCEYFFQCPILGLRFGLILWESALLPKITLQVVLIEILLGFSAPESMPVLAL
jgi:hypothetical protein